MVYNEEYLIDESRVILEEYLGEENLIRFEGVKSFAFFKLFKQ